MTNVEQQLVTICLHEELCKAKHTLARGRPLSSPLLDDTLLGFWEFFEWRKCVKKRMVAIELYTAPHCPETTAAFQKFFVGCWQRNTEAQFKLGDVIIRGWLKNMLQVTQPLVHSSRKLRETPTDSFIHVDFLAKFSCQRIAQQS